MNVWIAREYERDYEAFPDIIGVFATQAAAIAFVEQRVRAKHEKYRAEAPGLLDLYLSRNGDLKWTHGGAWPVGSDALCLANCTDMDYEIQAFEVQE